MCTESEDEYFTARESLSPALEESCSLTPPHQGVLRAAEIPTTAAAAAIHHHLPSPPDTLRRREPLKHDGKSPLKRKCSPSPSPATPCPSPPPSPAPRRSLTPARSPFPRPRPVLHTAYEGDLTYYEGRKKDVSLRYWTDFQRIWDIKLWFCKCVNGVRREFTVTYPELCKLVADEDKIDDLFDACEADPSTYARPKEGVNLFFFDPPPGGERERGCRAKGWSVEWWEGADRIQLHIMVAVYRGDADWTPTREQEAITRETWERLKEILHGVQEHVTQLKTKYEVEGEGSERHRGMGVTEREQEDRLALENVEALIDKIKEEAVAESNQE